MLSVTTAVDCNLAKHYARSVLVVCTLGRYHSRTGKLQTPERQSYDRRYRETPRVQTDRDVFTASVRVYQHFRSIRGLAYATDSLVNLR